MFFVKSEIYVESLFDLCLLQEFVFRDAEKRLQVWFDIYWIWIDMNIFAAPIVLEQLCLRNVFNVYFCDMLRSYIYL